MLAALGRSNTAVASTRDMLNSGYWNPTVSKNEAITSLVCMLIILPILLNDYLAYASPIDRAQCMGNF
jgi:hypothetical protein